MPQNYPRGIGSAPGIWGLESLELVDKVDNVLPNSFVENLHFEVDANRRRLTGASSSLTFEVHSSY